MAIRNSINLSDNPFHANWSIMFQGKVQVDREAAETFTRTLRCGEAPTTHVRHNVGRELPATSQSAWASLRWDTTWTLAFSFLWLFAIIPESRPHVCYYWDEIYNWLYKVLHGPWLESSNLFILGHYRICIEHNFIHCYVLLRFSFRNVFLREAVKALRFIKWIDSSHICPCSSIHGNKIK